MTPAQILEEAKGRFMVLYHDNPLALEKLLRQALGKFQDKAGALAQLTTREAAAELPPCCRAVAMCHDARRRYIPHRLIKIRHRQRGEEIQGGEKGQDHVLPMHGRHPHYPRGRETAVVELMLGSKHEAPYIINYFLNLRDWPLHEDLPGDCDSLLGDYLEALIAVQNTERQRNVMLSTGQNPADLPTVQDLKTRIIELEQAMEDNKAFIPTASSF